MYVYNIDSLAPFHKFNVAIVIILSTILQVLTATRFLTAAQLDAYNNLTPDRYIERINQRFSQGDFDWNNDVPDVNDVNTKLKFNDGTDESVSQREVEEVEEFPSYVKQQHGLTLYPDGAKEAYLKALEASQIAKLGSFMSLEQRLSKPYVFSYFENVPGKIQSDTDTCISMIQDKPRPLKLKGKRAEMKHIFGKINPNDYYPGQRKNPIRKKKVQRRNGNESSNLTTDWKSSFKKHPKTERILSK